MKLAISIIFVMGFATGCGMTPGTSGSANSTVNNAGGVVGGNITSSAQTGSGGTGGALTQTTDVKVAIDPSALTSIFGSASTPVRPNTEQLNKLEGLAMGRSGSSRTDLLKNVSLCRNAGERCLLVGL